MDEKDTQDLAYLIVGGFVAVAVMRFWTTKVKPWLSDLVPSLKDEGHIAVGSIDVATSDAVAAGVIVVVLLVIALTLRSWVRSKKRVKKKNQQLV